MSRISSSKKLARFVSATALVISALALFLYAGTGAGASEPSNETLARLFVHLATGREFGKTDRVVRWEQPIKYVVISRNRNEVAIRAPEVLKEFAAIAGVSVRESPVLSWSDSSVFPEDTYMTEDGFRAFVEIVDGKRDGAGPEYLLTWGVGDELMRARANLLIFVDDRRTLVDLLAGGDAHVEARRRDLDSGRIDCLIFLHKNENHHITLGVVLLNSELSSPGRTTCLNEELFQILGLVNDTQDSPLTMLDQVRSHFTSTPTEYDKLLLRLLYHQEMETGLDSEKAMRRALELLPGLRDSGE